MEALGILLRVTLGGRRKGRIVLGVQPGGSRGNGSWQGMGEQQRSSVFESSSQGNPCSQLRWGCSRARLLQPWALQHLGISLGTSPPLPSTTAGASLSCLFAAPVSDIGLGLAVYGESCSCPILSPAVPSLPVLPLQGSPELCCGGDFAPSAEPGGRVGIPSLERTGCSPSWTPLLITPGHLHPLLI